MVMVMHGVAAGQRDYVAVAMRILDATVGRRRRCVVGTWVRMLKRGKGAGCCGCCGFDLRTEDWRIAFAKIIVSRLLLFSQLLSVKHFFHKEYVQYVPYISNRILGVRRVGNDTPSPVP